jgi:EAL and modified HD-GYP domain-containing signal transduction protein
MLDVGGSPPDAHLLALTPREDLWIEVPSVFVADPAGAEIVVDLHIKGFSMVMRGRPLGALGPELLEAFRMSLIPVDQDRRMTEAASVAEEHAGRRNMPYTLTGVNSIAQMEQAFETGAMGVIGWPFLDAVERAESASANPSFGTVAKLIQMIGAQAEPAEMEQEVRRDPALAFRLLRYLNSPAFGLRVEVQSFQHALMMLGYKRLRKWLALLMATAARDRNLQPVMFASLRRGFLLERLNQDNPDQQVRDEAFILGVFSLLDKLFKEPFESLFERLPIPESVYEALVNRSGPLFPYLNVAAALEQSVDRSVQDAIDDAFISLEDCNLALLSALGEGDSTAAGATA